MLNDLAKEVHSVAKEKGWWDEPQPTLGEIIALCHAELSEALEAYRDGQPHHYYFGDKPEGIAVELADCIIRILDYCGYADIDIDRIIREKIEYNKTRPYRHGDKKL